MGGITKIEKKSVTREKLCVQIISKISFEFSIDIFDVISNARNHLLTNSHLC